VPDLAKALADIEPTFAALRAAMAFTVDDAAFTTEWERLSKVADRISQQLRALMPDSCGIAHGRAAVDDSRNA
jgi:hypothetical protein